MARPRPRVEGAARQSSASRPSLAPGIVSWTLSRAVSEVGVDPSAASATVDGVRRDLPGAGARVSAAISHHRRLGDGRVLERLPVRPVLQIHVAAGERLQRAGQRIRRGDPRCAAQLEQLDPLLVGASDARPPCRTRIICRSRSALNVRSKRSTLSRRMTLQRAGRRPRSAPPPSSSGATCTHRAIEQSSGRRRSCRYVMPTPEPFIRPRENRTSPGREPCRPSRCRSRARSRAQPVARRHVHVAVQRDRRLALADLALVAGDRERPSAGPLGHHVHADHPRGAICVGEQLLVGRCGLLRAPG